MTGERCQSGRGRRRGGRSCGRAWSHQGWPPRDGTPRAASSGSRAGAGAGPGTNKGGGASRPGRARSSPSAPSFIHGRAQRARGSPARSSAGAPDSAAPAPPPQTCLQTPPGRDRDREQPAPSARGRAGRVARLPRGRVGPHRAGATPRARGPALTWGWSCSRRPCACLQLPPSTAPAAPAPTAPWPGSALHGLTPLPGPAACFCTAAPPRARPAPLLPGSSCCWGRPGSAALHPDPRPRLRAVRRTGPHANSTRDSVTPLRTQHPQLQHGAMH